MQGRELSYPATPASSVRGGGAYLARPSAELPLRAASVASSAAVTDDLEARPQPPKCLKSTNPFHRASL